MARTTGITGWEVACPEGAPRAVAEPTVLLLAPHIAEELWSKLGSDQSLTHGPMPEADE